MRMVSVSLNVVVQFFDNALSMIRTSDVFYFDNDATGSRQEVLNRITVTNFVGWIFWNQVGNPWAEHQIERVLYGGLTI